MARDLFNRYVWLVDTIRRYGRITRVQLNECWAKSQFANGARELPRRTFCNYREAAEELFNIEIKCDPTTFEYYIEGCGEHEETFTDWLLNSSFINEVLNKSRDISERIFVENVPSARHFLAPVIEAMRENLRIRFDYQAFTRLSPTRGIELEPYFIKLFRQRWYVVGRNVSENRIKTYALDRISNLVSTLTKFRPDPTFDAEEYFRNSFGIVRDNSEVLNVKLRVSPLQAKYFRALPLHPSQEEFVHDDYSVFHYRLRVTPDLVTELLSYGNRVEVLAPPTLRARMRQELEEALELYRDRQSSCNMKC